jgi:hypothetical protein
MKITTHLSLIILLAVFTSTAFTSTGALASTVEEGHAQTTPWSGYWWPHRQGALLKPLAKYDTLTGKKAEAWERKTHPPGDDVPKWHGYCHAWAAASLMETEPVKSRSAGPQGQVQLGVGDQKGLLSVCHARDVANSWGDRFGDNQGSEDKQDLAPDTLWRLLKLYVQQQGVPLVLDVEAGAEVWNYPIYAYRIEHAPQGGAGQQLARLTLWMADDAVAPDYVGVKVRRQSYQFTFTKRNESVVMGSAKWVGPSKEDHPDFAWYPYVAVAENPEIDYAIVRNLVGVAQQPNTPQPNPTLPATPDVSTSPAPDPDNPSSHPSPGPETPVANRRPPASVVSPLELVSLIANKTSSFGLDISVDRFGGRYEEGDELVVTGVSDRDGYLSLLYISAEGDLSLLYPQAGDNNQIRAKQEFTVPGAKADKSIRVAKPFGTHRIKAVVTSRPLHLSGLYAWQEKYEPKQPPQSQAQAKPPATAQGKPEAKPQPDTQPSPTGKPSEAENQQAVRATPYQSFRWHPTQRRLVQRLLLAYIGRKDLDEEQFGNIDPHAVLGEFAQDEAAFYVGPQEQKV